MRRVISLWFPSLAIDRLRRAQNGDWRDEPLALTAESAGKVLVTAVSEAASMAGIFPGMALADARAVLPSLATRPADPAAAAALRERIVAWCGRYTPWTAPEGADGVWLDVTGCAHLFGGEAAMLDDLLSRLAGFGLRGRAALAETPGAAWALAHYGEDRAIVAPGGLQESLQALPVAALRLGPVAVSGLRRLGLKRIGDLDALPRAPLTARFGGELALRLDQALGRVAEPLSPRCPPPRCRVRLGFADPIGLPEDIAAGLRQLLHRLCARLDRLQQGCRRLELTLYRVDGSVQSAAVGTASPAREARHLDRLFAERLAHLDPGFGVESMVLSAPVTEPLTPAQIESPASARTPSKPKAGKEPGHEPIAPLLDRLGNRLGFDHVIRLHPCESHLPDRLSQALPVGEGAADADWRPGPIRPLRLLDRPEPLETLSAVPEEGPPDAFLWRRVRHRLRAAEGPERIAPEWWRADPDWDAGARDYWHVEDEAGRRFWLFREVRARRDGTARWFLHGLFA